MKDDTISRAAAINAICEDGTQLERQGRYSMTMVERKQRDADILDALPSAQRWIPTTERLPDENTEVLVSVVEVEGERFELIDIILNGEWLNCDKNEWIVEAWMPLPAPYRREGR